MSMGRDWNDVYAINHGFITHASDVYNDELKNYSEYPSCTSLAAESTPGQALSDPALWDVKGVEHVVFELRQDLVMHNEGMSLSAHVSHTNHI
jgi:hypothetical protein